MGNFDWSSALEIELAGRASSGDLILSGGWQPFLARVAPQISKPAFFHKEYWEWYWGALKAKEAGIPFPRGKNAFFAVWSRGFGKCKGEDTLLQLADGTKTRIKNIKTGDTVLSYNEVTGKVESDVVSGVIKSGPKECVAIKVQTGDVLTLTNEDRVYTFDGWKLVSELVVGDRIASPRKLTITANVDYTHSDEEVKFLAYMLAEGACSGKGRAINANFTNEDPVIVDDFYKCVAKLGFSIRPVQNSKLTHTISKGVRPWLFEHGLAGKLSKNKSCPEWVFRLPEKQKWLFLSAMIDTDGYVIVRDGVGITLASEQLIDDLRQLFLHVGVVTTKDYKPNNKAGAWVLRVDHEGMQLCVENFTLLLKGYKLEEWSKRNLYRFSLIDVYPPSIWDNLPRGMNRFLRSFGIGDSGGDFTRIKLRRILDKVELESWRWLEDADVFWNRVDSVESVGEIETYDVEVLNNHNVIAENLVTHNSSNSWLAPILEAALLGNGYCLYVSGDQRRANTHLGNIVNILTSDAIKKEFPGLSSPKKGVTGQTKNWRQEFVQTESGYVLHAVGLDVGVRGTNVDFQRVSLIVLDDVDDLGDTPASAQKKLEILTKSIIPTGTASTIIISAQNLIHEFGVINQIVSGRVSALSARQLSGPYPAIYNLVTQSQFIDGVRRDIIISGNPTWPDVVGIPECQQFIDNSGLPAFLSEYQHDLEGSKEGLVVPEFNDEAHVITWGEFNARYGFHPTNREIPSHWTKQVGHDWGSTGSAKHACVVSFLTMSASDSKLPGVSFLYKGLSFDESPLVDDTARTIINAVAPEVIKGSKDGIGERFSSWLDKRRDFTLWHASHEAKAVRDVYRIVYRIPFQACNPAKGGIEQMRHYLHLDMSEDHPFRPDTKGRAMWYWIVEDKQKLQPRNDAGLKLWREQFPRWRMKPTHLTDAGWQSERPVKANDDCGNSLQMLTMHWSLTPAPLTQVQKFEAAMPEHLRYDNLLKGRKGLTAEEEIAYTLSRARVRKSLNRSPLLDEWGQPLR